MSLCSLLNGSGSSGAAPSVWIPTDVRGGTAARCGAQAGTGARCAAQAWTAAERGAQAGTGTQDATAGPCAKETARTLEPALDATQARTGIQEQGAIAAEDASEARDATGTQGAMRAPDAIPVLDATVVQDAPGIRVTNRASPCTDL